MAATAAALVGQRWDLRLGSLTDPVAGDTFNTIVSNPPFVVSPGLSRDVGRLSYRDSGLAGDAVVRTLLQTLPGLLAEGGTAQLLANWTIPADGQWDAPLTAELADRGVDAWIWQREALDPVAYVTLWLRDAGEDPASSRWAERFDAWLAWFRQNSIMGVGMGLVTLRRVFRPPVVVCEDVPQEIDIPSGPLIAGWLERVAWLAATSDAVLLDTRLRRDPDVQLTTTAVAGSVGWSVRHHTLTQRAGLRFSVPTDRPVATVIAGCDGTRPLGLLATVLAAALGEPTDAVCAALLPAVRDLVRRGILLPPPPAEDPSDACGPNGAVVIAARAEAEQR